MTRSLRSRVEAVERARRDVEAEGITWGDVVAVAAGHFTALEALPPAERERRDAERIARDKAAWGRCLSGRMTRAEIDGAFPPEPPRGDGPWTWERFAALRATPYRKAALVNLSRRDRGLPTGCDRRDPEWTDELRRLGGAGCGDEPLWVRLEDPELAPVLAAGCRAYAEYGRRRGLV